MKFSEFCFVDTATSGLASRSDVRKIQEWTQICLSSNLGLPQGQKEWYRSWFRFPASLEIHWRNNKNSVAGYRGEHILDFLFIDVDGKDLAEALDLLRKSLDILFSKGVKQEHLSLFFSGSKGFHVYLHAGAFLPEPDVLNFSIAKTVAESLFGQLLGTKVDAKNFEINRLVREAGTINEKSGLYKTPISLEDFHLITPDSIRDVSLSGVFKPEFFDGSLFWECAPVPALADLWKESSEKLARGTYGVQARVASPGAYSAPRPSTMQTEMPACIANMLQHVSQGTLPEGYGNQVLSILAAHYRWMPEDATLGMLLGMLPGLNKNRKDKITEFEVKTSVRQVYERGYRTGCGSKDSTWGTTCLFFCNEQHTVEACPKHAVGNGENRVWYRAKEARNLGIADLKKGVPPYRFGFREWDEFLGGVGFGQPIFFEGHKGTGKTTLIKRFTRHMAEIAYSRNEVVVFASPEQAIAEQVRLDMRALSRMTKKELRNALDGGYADRAMLDWFEKYSDTMLYMDVSEFDLDFIKKSLQDIEQRLGKKVAVFCLDGLIFLQAMSKDKGYRADLNVVAQCLQLTRKMNLIGIYIAHYGKGERSKGQKLEENRTDGMGAYGTAMVSIGAALQGGLYWKDGAVWLQMFKVRDREEGEFAIEDVPFVMDRRSSNVYTLEEVKLARARGIELLSYASLEKLAKLLNANEVAKGL